MVRPESTAGWRDLVRDLERQIQASTARMGDIDQRRRVIALDAATGNKAAQAESQKLLDEKSSLAASSSVIVEALAASNDALRASERDDDLRAELARMEAMDRALQARHAAARLVDGKLAELMTAIGGWMETGDAVKALEPGYRWHAGELHRAVWFALSAAGLNKTRGAELRALDVAFNGQSRPSPAHWVPLADASHADEEKPE